MAVAVRRINYAAFAALLTPVFVLLAESGGPHLTRTRIVDTLAGGALALAGALTLWPTRELERMPALIASLLQAERDYLAAVLRGADQAALLATRRRVGLTAANAEAALQRLLGEAQPADRIQPLMSLLAYARRDRARRSPLLGTAPPPPDAGARMEEMLAGLAEAARVSAPPPSFPALDEAGLPEAARRLLRQIRVAHSALARLTARS